MNVHRDKTLRTSNDAMGSDPLGLPNKEIVRDGRDVGESKDSGNCCGSTDELQGAIATCYIQAF